MLILLLQATSWGWSYPLVKSPLLMLDTCSVSRPTERRLLSWLVFSFHLTSLPGHLQKWLQQLCFRLQLQGFGSCFTVFAESSLFRREWSTHALQPLERSRTATSCHFWTSILFDELLSLPSQVFFCNRERDFECKHYAMFNYFMRLSGS